ncbi:MAG: diaminopimelate epimerase [Solobacterium sp.]|nr:diaminopimelate epimerase [Solobacterium sp.]
MRFTKMQGLGNDYLYFHEEVPANVSQLSILLSDRHYGIGSDGLIYITHSAAADFGMRVFNADGSEALMCGNGIRCVGRYIYEKGLSDKTDLLIETRSGIRRLQLHVHEGKVTSVSVNMGTVTVSSPQKIEIEGQTYTLYPVSTGNPHAVIFVEEEGLSLPEKIGSLIEHHSMFPDGVNCEFVHVRPDGTLRMRVWERGSGVTMACGTGATATAAAAIHTGMVPCDQPVFVELDGGMLEFTKEQNGEFLMKGPAGFVCEAEIEMEGVC